MGKTKGASFCRRSSLSCLTDVCCSVQCFFSVYLLPRLFVFFSVWLFVCLYDLLLPLLLLKIPNWCSRVLRVLIKLTKESALQVKQLAFFSTVGCFSFRCMNCFENVGAAGIKTPLRFQLRDSKK